MILLFNLTPHTVRIVDNGGKTLYVFPPTYPPARVSAVHNETGMLGDVPFASLLFGEVENLPPAQPGVFYIVSAFVLQACPDRADLVRPDSGPDAQRDRAGRIVAVRRLTR